MSEKFQIMMNTLDEDLLEEAFAPVKRRKYPVWIGAAIAACMLLVIGLIRFPGYKPAVTLAELSEKGYEMMLPEQAEQVRYELVTLNDQECAQVSFRLQDTQYVYQAVKTRQVQPLRDSKEDHPVLSWNAGQLDIQLLSSSSGTSVSWYTAGNQTQWYLTADADTMEVLTTASRILHVTGLDVTVAPENAENITYNAFCLDELTVAETTFRLAGVTYTYRMAGTMELLENFADISGLEGPFHGNAEGDVFWCRAKISFNEGGQGKIVWFDLVPGILYSLSMDSGATEESLLDMANSLFEPAQDNN